MDITEEATNVATSDVSERLNKIASALRMLVESAFVYGGPRRNLAPFWGAKSF
jgi:hypothetical protein